MLFSTREDVCIPGETYVKKHSDIARNNQHLSIHTVPAFCHLPVKSIYCRILRYSVCPHSQGEICQQEPFIRCVHRFSFFNTGSTIRHHNDEDIWIRDASCSNNYGNGSSSWSICRKHDHTWSHVFNSKD